MRIITAAAVAAMLLTTPAHATFWGSNNKNSNVNNNSASASAAASASARASAAQKQAQGQIQGQSQTQANKQTNKQTNNQSVSFDSPAFTYGVQGVISSMVNDRCGRVAFGVPFSAHTCNVLMEAEALQAALTPVYGAEKAAQTAVLHMARLDRTIRETLRAAGIVK